MLDKIMLILCFVMCGLCVVIPLLIWIRNGIRWRQLQQASPVVTCRARLELVYRYRRKLRTVFLTEDGQRVGLAVPEEGAEYLREGREGMLTYKGDSMQGFE